ncbi:MAG TPA: LytTR family DNA-binding domain-containing protein [Gaiellaceae bacterium]|nr:LytTR family DNA-binding domain-containing protein [Gaiellaceae bacterium]
MTIRALIVDDEQPARDELRYLLARHDDVEVVGDAAAAGAAVAAVRSTRPDVVFLDVELPAASGLAAAPLLRDLGTPPAVVFVTAHERYAVDAFAVEAFDYLLKPVDPDRLARVLERLRERAAAGPAQPERVAVVGPGGSELLLDPAEIHYVRAEGDYSRVHTHDRSYLSTSPLGALEERLGSPFARVHRSYLVNLGKVTAVRRAGGDRLRLQLADAARTELDVSRRQARRVRERLRL